MEPSIHSIDTIEDYNNACSTYDIVPATDIKTRNNLLDCTLRDGGYVNNWQFNNEFINSYIKLMSPIVGVLEIGFVNIMEDYRELPVGKCRSLTREQIHDMKNISDSECLIAVMGDVATINLEVLIPKNTDVDIVRLAISNSNIKKAKDLYSLLVVEGYTVCMNYMSTHMYDANDLINHAKDTPEAIIYIVDTIGCMNTSTVTSYVETLQNHGICIGLHLHNNLQRAAGTYDLLEKKCVFIDGTIMGMGRGSGNLPIELCNVTNKQRFEILSFYDSYMKNISRDWGYKPEYIMQAYCNCHPNFPSKMIDMGLNTTYIMDIIFHQMKDITNFSIKHLTNTFQTANAF